MNHLKIVLFIHRILEKISICRVYVYCYKINIYMKKYAYVYVWMKTTFHSYSFHYYSCFFQFSFISEFLIHTKFSFIIHLQICILKEFSWYLSFLNFNFSFLILPNFIRIVHFRIVHSTIYFNLYQYFR